MDTNNAVKDLYEQFPYPPPADDMAEIKAGEKRPTWNPKDSFPVLFPSAPAREDLEILVAGCGTRAAVMFAAYMPEAKVFGIDISEASVARSTALAAEHGLENIEHQVLRLEEVESLGRQFDLIHCHGVLHHLEDPAVGLKSLGTALRPEGAISVMVYGRYGRTGVYMMQDFCRIAGLGVNVGDPQKVRQFLTTLAPEHPFFMVGFKPGIPIPVEEVADMTLHPRDRSYTTRDVRDLVSESGLRFHRWLPQGPYIPRLSGAAQTDVIHDLQALDREDQEAAMELYHGTMRKHIFVVTHPDRPTPEELFGGDKIFDAVPSMSQHLMAERVGDDLVLRNGTHEATVQIRVNATAMATLFQAMEGEKTIGDIVERGPASQLASVEARRIAETYRFLYEGDVVDLHTRT